MARGVPAQPAGRWPGVWFPGLDPRPVRPAAEPDRAGRSLIVLKPTAMLAARRGPAIPSRLDRGPDPARLDRRGGERRSARCPRVKSLRVFPAERIAAPGALDQQLVVTAEFADGTTRDVTRQAAYDVSDPTRAEVSVDGLVTPTRRARRPSPSATWAAGESAGSPSWPTGPASSGDGRRPSGPIDTHVFAKLKALRINPSPGLRRFGLPAPGLPRRDRPAARSRRSPRVPRRPIRTSASKLVDRLVERPEFADFWALKWADLLRNEEKTMGEKGVWVFQRWLRDQIARDVPLDELVRRIVAGLGSTWQNPPSSFHRTNRDPMTAAETVGQVFLGVRLQCARCHNHPFDVWTQDDYYGLAAFFGNVARKQSTTSAETASTSTRSTATRSSTCPAGPGWSSPGPARCCSRSAPSGPAADRPARRRRQRPRATGRLADPRQPPVQPEPGQSGLVSPDGPGHRRAGRRFPRLEPAVQPRAARRADGSLRGRRDAAQAAGRLDHEVADLPAECDARSRPTPTTRRISRTRPSGCCRPRCCSTRSARSLGVPERFSHAHRRRCGRPSFPGRLGRRRVPEGLRQARPTADLRMRAVGIDHAGPGVPDDQRRDGPHASWRPRQPDRQAAGGRRRAMRDLLNELYLAALCREPTAGRADGRRPRHVGQRPRSAERPGKTWPGRSSTARNSCCGIDSDRATVTNGGIDMTRGALTSDRRAGLSRRRLLQAGIGGHRRAEPARAAPGRARTPGSRARAKHIIFLHQFGGPSHIDTFDMKPDAPDGIRGEFKPIATGQPGLSVTEHLPRFATVIDQFAQVRSVNHRMKNHNSATYYSLTGHAPPLDDIRLRDTQELYPAYGSTVAKLRPVEDPAIPSFVSFPHVLRDGSVTPGQHASFLGKAFDPFFIGQDPNRAGLPAPRAEPAVVACRSDRLDDRRGLAAADRPADRSRGWSETARGIDAFYARALTMLASPKVKRAFDLSQEPDELRDEYGRTTYGQSCLLARRLVEAGVRFVSVYYSAVDRRQGQRRLGHARRQFQPAQESAPADHRPDRADLDPGPRSRAACSTRRWSSGWASSAARPRSRTPSNSAPTAATTGRSATPSCLAGGGITPGAIYGSSDRIGAYPGHRPGHPRRHRRDHVLGPRHRPGHRGPRHPGPAAAHRRRQADHPVVWIGNLTIC